MNLTLPVSLIHAHDALPWDDRGLCYEFPAGGNLTWSNTHTDLGNPYGPPVDQFGADINAGALGKVMIHDRPIPADWMIDAIPPIGTAVWQLLGRDRRIVRTSYIGAIYRGGFISVRLFPGGPNPGEPVGGDSGSICFVRHKGQWKVLGNCNTAGTCSLPFWDTNLPTNGGRTIPPRNTVAQDFDQWSKIWLQPGEPTIVIMKELFLPAPPTNRRVVGMMREGDDGTDNVELAIPDISPIQRLRILGAPPDAWVWPDNGNNWIIRAFRADGAVRLWFKQSAPGATYTVEVNGVVVPHKVIPARPEPTPETPTAPAQPGPADQTIADLRARVGELLDENESLREELAETRTALQAVESRLNALIAARNAFLHG